jgi:hypothetical protein
MRFPTVRLELIYEAYGFVVGVRNEDKFGTHGAIAFVFLDNQTRFVHTSNACTPESGTKEALIQSFVK